MQILFCFWRELENAQWSPPDNVVTHIHKTSCGITEEYNATVKYIFICVNLKLKTLRGREHLFGIQKNCNLRAQVQVETQNASQLWGEGQGFS